MRRGWQFAGALVCAFVALAASPIAGASQHTFQVIAAEAVRPSLVLPPPPADGSAAARAELAELHRIAHATTRAQWMQAKWGNDHEDGQIFASVFGAGYDLKALPATAKLLAEVRNDEATAAALAKNYFQRNRPWIVDGSLRTCARDDDPRSSYPSGHSTMAFAMAVVLADAAPELAQRLMAFATAYAEDRLVCGMHFRSDIVAGQTLGTSVAVLMLRDPRVQADVAAARAELLAAHLIPAAG